MSIWYELGAQVLSNVLIMCGIVVLLNFSTNGFVLKYIKIRASQGKKMLIEEKGLTGWRFYVASKHEDVWRYKIAPKKFKVLTNLNKKGVSKKYGLDVVFIDGDTENILNIADNEAIPGYDPIKIDGMIQKLVKTKTAGDNNLVKIVIFLIIIAIIIAGVSAFYGFNALESINKLGALSGNI